jgi:hypothetical protein
MYDHVSSPCSRRRRGHALFSLVSALGGMIARSHFLIAPPAYDSLFFSGRKSIGEAG